MEMRTVVWNILTTPSNLSLDPNSYILQSLALHVLAEFCALSSTHLMYVKFMDMNNGIISFANFAHSFLVLIQIYTRAHHRDPACYSRAKSMSHTHAQYTNANPYKSYKNSFFHVLKLQTPAQGSPSYTFNSSSNSNPYSSFTVPQVSPRHFPGSNSHHYHQFSAAPDASSMLETYSVI